MNLLQPPDSRPPPPDYYGQALAAYKRRGIPDAEMGAAFFAAMSESLDILLKAAERGTD